MQKIIKQDLTGSEESASELAKYTWEKDEFAWFFDRNYKDVFKICFTGERWLSGNKWKWQKIYQFRYLDSSGSHEYKTDGLHSHGLSHCPEDVFYTNRQEAIDAGYSYIKKIKQECIETCNGDVARLKKYEVIENKEEDPHENFFGYNIRRLIKLFKK